MLWVKLFRCKVWRGHPGKRRGGTEVALSQLVWKIADFLYSYIGDGELSVSWEVCSWFGAADHTVPKHSMYGIFYPH